MRNLQVSRCWRHSHAPPRLASHCTPDLLRQLRQPLQERLRPRPLSGRVALVGRVAGDLRTVRVEPSLGSSRCLRLPGEASSSCAAWRSGSFEAWVLHNGSSRASTTRRLRSRRSVSAQGCDVVELLGPVSAPARVRGVPTAGVRGPCRRELPASSTFALFSVTEGRLQGRFARAGVTGSDYQGTLSA
jgi:hypothetical protein